MHKNNFYLNMRCRGLCLLSALFFSISLFAQDSAPIYLEVEVELTDQQAFEVLEEAQLDIDPFLPEIGSNTLVIRQDDLAKLNASGLTYTISVHDLASAIEARNIEDLGKYNPTAEGQEKTTMGFELGSMGGYYTLTELVAQLDEMATLYPNLITPKFSIGTSVEGRQIWAVKISDNPSIDESSFEAQVYFDALHHAREPASGSTVINFMFYLLENYGSDPAITYLINNREIHIVACVNPDGYVYNEQTNPNGGGFWRKNRRFNSGSSCRGVDLNRNYDTDFGGQGSSNNPCSDSYRGPSAFSEPESQAVRDFVNSIQPPIAYTTHTFGEYWLGPDFSNGTQEFVIYAEIGGDCMDENEYIHGDADLLLGYVSGTTQNWMKEAGILAWTPEIGTSFWPPMSEIIPLVNLQIKPFEYACWVAGALADYQGFNVLNSQGLSASQNLQLDIEIKNKGLTQAAQNVSVTVTADNAGVTAVNGTENYGNLASRTEGTNSTPFEFSVAGVASGTSVKFYVDVSQEGVVVDRDSFYMTVGDRSILFSDDAESGSGNWTNQGSGSTWQSSDEDAYTGDNCFVDSRISHTNSNNSRAFAMNSSVSLAGTSNPRLEFAAKWNLHTTTDYVRLQISTNGGGSWSNITTDAMETVNGGPAFKENERWTYQSVDLSAYIGQSVRFRFASFSNSSLRSDGFYFDDFRIADYADPPACSVSGSIVSQVCDGGNTVTTTDDSYTITVSATVTNGSGAYDVLVNGGQVAANIPSGNSASFSLPADGSSASISFRDASDNSCTSGTSSTGALSSCSPTCNDGIQNGSETDVDCGGPDCAPCPTCDDGIQNGSETDVDCGGPDCPACPTCDDGIQNGSETGVDCGGPDCDACPTCDDGIQNGDETGVDCGGSCPTVCPTCDDGIQNGDEIGVDCGGPDCPACPTCDDGIQNGSETGVDCGGPDCDACPTCDDGIQNGDETGVDCGGSCPTSCPSAGLQLEYGVLNNIGESWVTVPLNNTYNSMVVVASVVMPSSAQVPVVTRVRNASGNSFDLRIQTTNAGTSSTYSIHYVVVEEGVYTVAADGIKMEAVKDNSTVTAENNSWAFEAQSYQQSYSNPVVVGQVMTFNDADWSVFWASANGSRGTIPTSSSFAAGKNVGEDPDNTRANETVGYLVIESGSGTVANTEYTAGVGSDIVRGITNTSSGFAYNLSGLTGAQAAVVSAAAMDGNNGGWPVLYSNNPFSSSQLLLAFDEDVAADTERSHTTEQVAYFAFGASSGSPTCSDGIQNGNETGVDCGGPDCAPCPTCNDGIQNGNETGVDCGGPDCAPCPTCNDGIQNGNETGVDCGGPDCAACPTCNDGIQNGNETGVDCGGPDCAACPTCNDGIQNGNETGVDCGGPDCSPCTSCNDGIQNGDETGVDCGGSCPTACPTCSDGIQNGNETGVDCGGPDCAACPTCSDGIQNGNETGVDCGGPDCPACPLNYCGSAAANTTYEYIQSVAFNGQTNTSGNNGGYADFTGSVTFGADAGGSASISLTPGFPGSSYNEFWSVYIDYNADGDFTDAGELVFQSAGNNTRTGTINIPGTASLGTTRMRVQMQWNQYNNSPCQNFTYGEVEDYSLSIGTSNRFEADQDIDLSLVAKADAETAPEWTLYPNPARESISLRLANEASIAESTIIQLMSTDGRILQEHRLSEVYSDGTAELNLSQLKPGIYLVLVQAEAGQQVLRFVRRP